MRPRCWVLIVVVCGSAVRGADPVTPATVRATMKQLWSNNVDEAIAAEKALAADSLALPMLRQALATDPNPRHQGDLERVIVKAVAQRDKVNAERVMRWAKDDRLDLLTEVRALSNGDAAQTAIDQLLRRAQALKDAGQTTLTAKCPKSHGVGSRWWADGATFRRDIPKPLYASELELLESYQRSKQGLFGDRIDAPCQDMADSLVVCRSELSHFVRAKPLNAGRSEWSGCLLFANSTVQFQCVYGGLMVIDGDLELVESADFGGCVVVVNGNVTELVNAPSSAFSSSVVWATGDIRVNPRRGPLADTLFFAGGKIADADKLALKGCAVENVKEPPFAVRFLDPAEFGLTLDATKEGMKVAKVADKSAFAEGGLKAGDLIAKVGEVATATAPAFRRELRRGVIEGAVLLDVTRGKEKLELLVAVPDVPAVAKKKDDVKAAPPEKK